ncbi:MAG: DUF4214 domain-containing protein [Pirellulales bacterium]
MRFALQCSCLVGILSLVLVESATGAVRTRRIATGLAEPLYATVAPGDNSRLFIMQKNGQVRILDQRTGAILDTPYIDIGSRISTEGQDGLLGMAFHPNYASNGQVFLYYLDHNRNSQVSRFQVTGNPNVADAGTETYVLGFPQPGDIHAAGWIGFSPIDNYLYIPSGDGGGANDPFHQGQDPNTLLGTVIRVDVDGDDFPGDASRNYAIPPDNPFVSGGGAPENWAYGLRNPFRSSFDRQTGDFYVTDVGQGFREEVNFQRGDAAGGANYGWPLREGTIATPGGGVGGPRPDDNVDPVYDYAHGAGPFQGNAVAGGYVYRGPDPSLQGTYFFADFIRGTLWSIEIDRDTQTVVEGSLTDWTGLLAPDEGSFAFTTSLAEDAVGNLYTVSILGDVYKLEHIPEVAATGAHLNALYSDVMGRPADDGGLAYWGSEIMAGRTTYNDVVSSFLASRENVNNVIRGFYRQFLERDADGGGIDYWSDQMKSADEADVVVAFLTSAEFASRHESDDDFVDALYDLVLNRSADESGRAYYLGMLADGTSRAEAARLVAESTERYGLLVEEFYQSYFGRASDEAGRAYYVARLRDGSLDLQELARTFLTSDEYIYASHRAIGDFNTYIAGLPFDDAAPTAAVPEPAAAVIAMCGAVLIAVSRRRR